MNRKAYQKTLYTVLLHQADQGTYSRWPAPLHFAVEAGRTASGGTAAEPVSGLVSLLRDGVSDPAFAQVGANLTGGVRPVGKHMSGPGAGASTADPGT